MKKMAKYWEKDLNSKPHGWRGGSSPFCVTYLYFKNKAPNKHNYYIQMIIGLLYKKELKETVLDTCCVTRWKHIKVKQKWQNLKVHLKVKIQCVINKSITLNHISHVAKCHLS
jgi:hypothetical protein